jgi:hypothetical protein
MKYPFLILDDFGEPLRGFRSKKEALWFIENKPGLTIKKTGFKPEPVKKEANAALLYDQALSECGACLF